MLGIIAWQRTHDGLPGAAKACPSIAQQLKLAGKKLVALGAANGIGAACAARYAAEGARVVLADINLPAAQEAVAAIERSGGDALPLEVDIADEAMVEKVIATAAKWLGGIDGAHINAADLALAARDTDICDEELALFDRTLAVNLRGHVLCTRALLPHMLAGGQGAIVYTSSGSAERGEPTRPAYAIAKAGINALMRHVASRWGPSGITANCLSPGLTITSEMLARGNVTEAFKAMMLAKTPSTRLGMPEDMAGLSTLLLSDDARWINGQVIYVNGGSLMK